MDWYLGGLRKYAQFDGRARRKEYWMYSLFAGIFGLATGLIGLVLSAAAHSIVPAVLLIVALGLATFLPGLAVTVRRLHDTGRSGGWFFIALVPYVGGIILIVLLCQDSKPHNQYGPNPKDPTAGFYGNAYDAPPYPNYPGYPGYPSTPDYPGYGQPPPPDSDPYYGGRHSS